MTCLYKDPIAAGLPRNPRIVDSYVKLRHLPVNTKYRFWQNLLSDNLLEIRKLPDIQAQFEEEVSVRLMPEQKHNTASLMDTCL